MNSKKCDLKKNAKKSFRRHFVNSVVFSSKDKLIFVHDALL